VGITTGDLVIVVRDLHGHSPSILGRIFTVDHMGGDCLCLQCNTRVSGPSAFQSGKQGVPVSWLQKIPPLSELEKKELVMVK
jgi:hypothetical protein